MAEAQTSYTQFLTLCTPLCKESAFPFPRISVAWWMLADSLVGFARCPLWEAVSIQRSYLLSSGITEAQLPSSQLFDRTFTWTFGWNRRMNSTRVLTRSSWLRCRWPISSPSGINRAWRTILLMSQEHPDPRASSLSYFRIHFLIDPLVHPVWPYPLDQRTSNRAIADGPRTSLVHRIICQWCRSSEYVASQSIRQNGGLSSIILQDSA